jgi:hypothetical protein
MQFRCPANNCPIEVSDDLIGMRIRCPHCAAMLTVERSASETSAVQPGAPDGVSKPPKESVNLEHQIYDGLPPLSVMMALRRQQGAAFDADDFAARYPMTDDDWKALSAFESVLWSVVSLRTTVMLGALAVLVNLIVLGASISQGRGIGVDMSIQFLSLFVVAGLIVLVYMGSRALERIRLHALATFLPWVAFGVALVVLFNAVLDLGALQDRVTPAFPLLIAIPINLFVAFDSGRSAWRVDRSLNAVSPPEISHRLTEALKYLE